MIMLIGDFYIEMYAHVRAHRYTNILYLFIYVGMICLGLGEKKRNWIYYCISTVKIFLFLIIRS
jgi:hypothetical protein